MEETKINKEVQGVALEKGGVSMVVKRLFENEEIVAFKICRLGSPPEYNLYGCNTDSYLKCDDCDSLSMALWLRDKVGNVIEREITKDNIGLKYENDDVAIKEYCKYKLMSNECFQSDGYCDDCPFYRISVEEKENVWNALWDMSRNL